MARTRHVKRLVAVAIATGAITLAGCSDTSSGEDTASPSESPQNTAAANSQSGAATVGTASIGDLGSIVVSADGRTVYLFEKDSDGTSTCYDACAAAWPPVTVDGAPSGSGEIAQDKLGTTERRDGTSQVTYNGHPLYYYAEDPEPGDISGQDIEDFGAEWYALTPAGDKAEGE